MGHSQSPHSRRPQHPPENPSSKPLPRIIPWPQTYLRLHPIRHHARPTRNDDNPKSHPLRSLHPQTRDRLHHALERISFLESFFSILGLERTTYVGGFIGAIWLVCPCPVVFLNYGRMQVRKCVFERIGEELIPEHLDVECQIGHVDLVHGKIYLHLSRDWPSVEKVCIIQY